MENSVESLSGSSSSAVPAAAPRPVAAPRKSSAKSLDLNNKPKTTPKTKPPISAKPKILPLKTSGNESTASVPQTTRPKSIRITDDEIHGKVASELASILGRPRSSSKGLLSPTSYSVSDGPGTNKEDSITPGLSQQVSLQVSLPNPCPECTSLKPALMLSSPPAPSSYDSQGQSPKKPKPARPPPPSVKRPPPPVVKPTFKPALPETPAVSGAPGNIVKATPVARSPSTLPNSEQHQSSTKRRLEITVLGARPMSETSNIHIESQKVPLTPPPHPPLSTDESSSHGAPDTPNSVTSKPRRKPTIIRPSRPATTLSTDSPALVSKEGPGPIDNLAFSTGDTPPPKSQRVPTLPVSVNVNESKPVSHDSNGSTQRPVDIAATPTNW
ncbi:hypothetical protein EB796_000896 [Bugula neritina]|uniref:Uncharacterized protein n=1 Tax=Bugula neritina TaxID=10212 RepID=A0A7J7KRL5_BUGNE|nr:hypothetical protein EB796_000896 [Bugula neritina]